MPLDSWLPCWPSEVPASSSRPGAAGTSSSGRQPQAAQDRRRRRSCCVRGLVPLQDGNSGTPLVLEDHCPPPGPDLRSSTAAEFAARGQFRPGQTRRETGTQSQGSAGEPSPRDRPAAGTDVALHSLEVCVEGEPGALHAVGGPGGRAAVHALRVVVPRVRRPRDSVGPAVKTRARAVGLRALLVLLAVGSSSLVVEAGRRWNV
jgi:hypothetical protein